MHLHIGEPIMTDNNSVHNSSPGSDKRYFPRWEVTGRTSYSLEGDQNIYEGKTKDLSCAGACIVGDGHIAPQQKINVTIELSEGTSIKLTGHILWVRSEDGQRQMGITFYDTPDDVQELILKYAFEIDKNKVINHWFKGWDGSRS